MTIVTLHTEASPSHEVAEPLEEFSRRPLDGLCRKVLRWTRRAAYRVLDLETEFEIVA